MRITLNEAPRRRTERRKGTGRRRSFSTLHNSVAQARPQTRQAAPRRRPPPALGPRAQARPSRAQTLHRPEPIAPTAVRGAYGRLGRLLLTKWWLLLLGSALLAAIVYVSTDEAFFVYDAQIVGAHHLDAKTIYDAAGIHEQNILWIRPHQVAQRILQVDGVEFVRIRASLPAQVRIEIEEREPVLMWRSLTQKQDWWVDQEGVVLPYHGDAQAADMLFVVDSSQGQLKVGDRLQPEGIVQAVRQLAAALPGTRVFYHDPQRGLSYVKDTQNGRWPVIIGTGDDLARKMRVVEALTDYLRTHNIQPDYLDVRWVKWPTIGLPGRDRGEGN